MKHERTDKMVVQIEVPAGDGRAAKTVKSEIFILATMEEDGVQVYTGGSVMDLMLMRAACESAVKQISKRKSSMVEDLVRTFNDECDCEGCREGRAEKESAKKAKKQTKKEEVAKDVKRMLKELGLLD